MTTKSMKRRRHPDPVARSCLSRGKGSSSSSIAMPNNKKLRRCISWDVRPSKVVWKCPVQQEEDTTDTAGVTVSTSAESNKDKRGDDSCSTSNTNTNETWYSKEEYKQILLEQCLTVHIMRSLRTIAAKASTTDDDKDGSNGGNFNVNYCDELIKKNLIDPEEYCERGLESYQSEERRNEINSNRKLHQFLVIGEYVRQGVVGRKDPEQVRNVSMSKSKKSLTKAQMLAAIDQRYVQASNIDTKNKDEDSHSHSHSHSERKQEQPPPPQEQYINTGVKKEMTTPLDSLWSRDHQVNNNKNTIPSSIHAQGIKSMGMDKDMDTKYCNPFQSIQRNDTHVEQQQQQYHDLLLNQQQQQQQQQQYTQSQYHPQQHNSNSNSNNNINIPNGPSTTAASTMCNSMLAAYVLEERLFHQQQQQQQQYHQHVQRLLLLQQYQQQYQSLALATAARAGQPPR